MKYLPVVVYLCVLVQHETVCVSGSTSTTSTNVASGTDSGKTSTEQVTTTTTTNVGTSDGQATSSSIGDLGIVTTTLEVASSTSMTQSSITADSISPTPVTTEVTSDGSVPASHTSQYTDSSSKTSESGDSTSVTNEDSSTVTSVAGLTSFDTETSTVPTSFLVKFQTSSEEVSSGSSTVTSSNGGSTSVAEHPTTVTTGGGDLSSNGENSSAFITDKAASSSSTSVEESIPVTTGITYSSSDTELLSTFSTGNEYSSSGSTYPSTASPSNGDSFSGLPDSLTVISSTDKSSVVFSDASTIASGTGNSFSNFRDSSTITSGTDDSFSSSMEMSVVISSTGDPSVHFTGASTTISGTENPTYTSTFTSGTLDSSSRSIDSSAATTGPGDSSFVSTLTVLSSSALTGSEDLSTITTGPASTDSGASLSGNPILSTTTYSSTQESSGAPMTTGEISTTNGTTNSTSVVISTTPLSSSSTSTTPQTIRTTTHPPTATTQYPDQTPVFNNPVLTFNFTLTLNGTYNKSLNQNETFKHQVVQQVKTHLFGSYEDIVTVKVNNVSYGSILTLLHIEALLVSLIERNKDANMDAVAYFRKVLKDNINNNLTSIHITAFGYAINNTDDIISEIDKWIKNKTICCESICYPAYECSMNECRHKCAHGSQKKSCGEFGTCIYDEIIDDTRCRCDTTAFTIFYGSNCQDKSGRFEYVLGISLGSGCAIIIIFIIIVVCLCRRGKRKDNSYTRPGKPLLKDFDDGEVKMEDLSYRWSESEYRDSPIRYNTPGHTNEAYEPFGSQKRHIIQSEIYLPGNETKTSSFDRPTPSLLKIDSEHDYSIKRPHVYNEPSADYDSPYEVRQSFLHQRQQDKYAIEGPTRYRPSEDRTTF